MITCGQPSSELTQTEATHTQHNSSWHAPATQDGGENHRAPHLARTCSTAASPATAPAARAAGRHHPHSVFRDTSSKPTFRLTVPPLTRSTRLLSRRPATPIQDTCGENRRRTHTLRQGCPLQLCF